LEVFDASAIIVCLASRFLLAPTYEAVAQIAVLASGKLSDCAAAVKSPAVLEQVSDDFGLSYTFEELSDMVAAKTAAAPLRVSVIVTHGSPSLARDLADAIADAASTYIGAETAKVMEYAQTPQTPSSPNIPLNTLLGGIVGLAIAVIVALIVSIMDDNVISDEDVYYHMGVRTLATIPPAKSGRKGGKGDEAAAPPL
jgi:capsular polysaccharide biosynthesis protein